MRSRQTGKFDTGDAPARSHGSTVTFMQTLRRVGVILTWFAGLAFVLAAANKNDPYLIALRGSGNVVLTVTSLAAFAVLIRRGYWSRRRTAGKLLVLMWCLPSLAMLGAHVSFESARKTLCKPMPRWLAASKSISSWANRHSMKWRRWPRRA